MRSGLKQEVTTMLFDYVEQESDLKGYELINKTTGEIDSSFEFTDLKTKYDLIRLFESKMNLEVIDDPKQKTLTIRTRKSNE